MNYKALVLDIDGTVVENREDALPSARVAQAISAASKKVHVSLATGRPLFKTKAIFDHLHLTGPCIVTDGTQIYDPLKNKFIYEAKLEKKLVKKIYGVVKKFHVPMFINDGVREYEYDGGPIRGSVYVIFVPSIPKELADAIVTHLKDIPTIHAYKGVDWTPGMEYVIACDLKGTKQHGIMEVAKLLGIETKEIIGVGDGYNDFPMLLACGLKIAMGNAVPELKAIADFVAPTVEEDGVAMVIEKFILKR